MEKPWEAQYSKWRHGGWYVTNVRYIGGAVGCVSNNGASDFPVDSSAEKLHPDKMGFGFLGGRDALHAGVRHLQT